MDKFLSYFSNVSLKIKILLTRYSAEVHMVHYNTKYDNFSQAVAFQDGLAVLAIMVDVSASY